MDAMETFFNRGTNDGEHYPLEWLDQLVTVVLNPSETGRAALTQEWLELICSLLPNEQAKLQSRIKAQVFNLHKQNEIELLVRRYHSALIILLDQCLAFQKSAPSKNLLLRQVYKLVLNSLDQLLSFIETRFPEFLGLEMRAPATYLALYQKELRKKADRLKIRVQKFIPSNQLADIVLKALYRFTDSVATSPAITFRAVLYHKELVQQLEKVNCEALEIGGFSTLDELLIYMNFNSKSYIRYLTGSILERVSACEAVVEKMDMLLFCNKAFNQFHRKSGMVLNPQHLDLETVIGNWFVQEIRYLEKKMQWSSAPLPENPKTKEPAKEEKAALKVLIALSSDQASLILRAADESRILVARSLSEVFKTVAPHLTTPYTEVLSYKGMRTQSYVAEDRDKEIAIEALEQIIRKIRGYGNK